MKKVKQKSLRQLARELEVSPSYLSMILSGHRKCPEGLRGTLSMFTTVHNFEAKSSLARRRSTAELLPPAQGFWCRGPESNWGHADFQSAKSTFS